MGFIIHFYIIIGTNQLTGGPAQIAIFCAYFSVSQKRNIKRSPNGMKPSGELFLEQTQPRRLGVDVKKQTRRPRGTEVRLPPWARLPASWPPRCFLDVHSKSPGLCLFQKRFSRRFHSVWTPFDIPFLRNTEIGKKNSNLHWASG